MNASLVFHALRRWTAPRACALTGGTLLFALPVGRERLCFNAHRVHAPATTVSYFDDLELAEFSAVDDSGALREYVPPDTFSEAHYACGLFRFRRPTPR